MKLLEGKTALVTGAARGIGKAIALKFASEGANIAFTDLTIDEIGAATEYEIASLGVKCKGYASNAANFEETHKVVEQVMQDFGRIDILINNAGITRDGLLVRMKTSDWQQVLDTNLTSAFLMSRAVAKDMMKAKNGRIINISSVVGVMGNAGQANYSASKAGLIGLTKSLARELAPKHITVNAVAPGFIETEMTDALSPQVKEQLLAQIPLNQLGQAEDIAEAVAYLAGIGGRYITGQVLQVNGGMAM